MITITDNILYSGPKLIQESKRYKCFGELIINNLKKFSDSVLLIDGVTGHKYTGRTIYDNVIRLVYCLKSLDVRENEVIGVCSENRYEYTIIVLATLCLNATIAPMNVTYTERELDHAIKLAKPKIMFISDDVVEILRKIHRKHRYVKKVFICGEKTEYFINFKWLLYNPSIFSTFNIEFKKPFDLTDNVAIIVYSSGTTGIAKAVQLTQMNILAKVDRFIERGSEATILISVIPWCHVYGITTMILFLIFGSTIIFLPKFDKIAFLRTIEQYKVNLALLVPSLVSFLAKHPLVNDYDLSSLKIITCGAAPLSSKIQDAAKSRIGLTKIANGYGLSETCSGVIYQTEKYCKRGSIGGMQSDLYAKVIDVETGKALGMKEQGELCFKGDCIMKGYVGDEVSTEIIIDNEGWLHTGDIGYYDEDFEFFIVDRIKELIKHKGFQVPPAEIESLLLSHPNIEDAAVVGLPDDDYGELPIAFVVKCLNKELTEQEVIDFVALNASPAKHLTGGVRFLPEIPRNSRGKILRRKLVEQLKNVISKL